ncbi:MAG TPA: hydrogenase maturation protease [Candidatus Krumholzibacteria bacterium]|nr:hydrogenase maturation protease [Candidatus Krumholzibacteria bacterium]HRX52632.1 hydrogenase maturation protease [Candidatus Krumholzibacteria bacterium]
MTVVMAVGNPAYGDDGVAAAVLAHLRGDGPPPGLELVDVHTDALALLDHFRPGERHVIVDAAGMGLPPGSVVRFGPEDVELRIGWDHLSMHGFGLAEAFSMARTLGVMPDDVTIIGVEPERVELGAGLSDAVAAAVPRAAALIRAEEG